MVLKSLNMRHTLYMVYKHNILWCKAVNHQRDLGGNGEQTRSIIRNYPRCILVVFPRVCLRCFSPKSHWCAKAVIHNQPHIV